VRVCVRACVLA